MFTENARGSAEAPRGTSPPRRTLGTTPRRQDHNVTTYRYFDLLVDSGLDLPELRPATRGMGASRRLQVELADGAPDLPPDLTFTVPTDEPDGGATYRYASLAHGYVLRFPGLADFVVSTHAGRVVGHPEPDTPPETLRHLLLDHVLARLVGQGGRLVLHASAYVEDGEAVAFVGRSGWGKSTLAVSFHGDGRRLLGDDCLLVEGQGESDAVVIPSYPGARLWPDSVDSLFQDLRVAGPVAHYSPKKRLVVPEGQEAVAGAPRLRALFLINDPHEDPANELRIEDIKGAGAVMALVGRTFLIDARNMTTVSALLGQAAEVLRRGVSLHSLRYERDLSRLGEVRSAVLDALER